MLRLGFVSCAPGWSKLSDGRKSAVCPNFISGPRSAFRAAMNSDSVAPVIRIVDTKFDGTSSVSVSMESVPASQAEAVRVAGNASLGATLRKKKIPTSLLPGAPAKIPDGMEAKDFYFPVATRNQAPVVTLSGDSLSVSYDAINPSIGGVSANSTDSIAFWKQTPSKYSAPDAPEVVPGAEVISTKLFEKYFPTKIRNRAPRIEMKAPRSAEDPTGGYFTLESELVELNTALASQLEVSASKEVGSEA